MNVPDLARDLMASGLVARVFMVAGAALVVAAVLMAALPRRPAGRVVGRSLAAASMVLLLPTALIGTVARVAGPAPAVLYSSCAEQGELPPLPGAPPRGCLLAVEWEQPGGLACGLVVTPGPIQLPAGTLGHWWYQSPAAAAQHIEAYQAAHPECTIIDQR